MDAPEYDCFNKGARVEVCFDEVGFRGSWYAATILETPSKKALKVFLEFDNLIDDDDPQKPLREHVHYILVRPLIPREPERSFQLNDDVDAFHNDGWWEGVVTQVHPASNAGPACYSVFFRSSREQIEFPASDLRLHREWVYGKWEPPLEGNADVDTHAPLEHHQLMPALSFPEASSPTELLVSKEVSIGGSSRPRLGVVKDG